MTAQVWIAVLVGIAAVADDLARRKISNWISVAALAGGLVWQAAQYGWSGLGYGLAGAAVGFSVFLALYLWSGIGGGDLKLMSGFGALLGTARFVEAALWTICFGVALVVAVQKWRGCSASPAATTIPYAPAIALGVWLALVSKG